MKLFERLYARFTALSTKVQIAIGVLIVIALIVLGNASNAAVTTKTVKLTEDLQQDVTFYTQGDQSCVRMDAVTGGPDAFAKDLGFDEGVASIMPIAGTFDADGGKYYMWIASTEPLTSEPIEGNRIMLFGVPEDRPQLVCVLSLSVITGASA